MTDWTRWVILIAVAYLVGSIPFGVLIGRAKGIDIRAHGSQNIGATNVGRVLGKKLGVLCFVLDFLKGAGPVLLAGYLNGIIGHTPNGLSALEMWLWLAVAAATVIGHMFSVFLAFRGGKGVATGFGSIAAMWPLLTLPAIGALVVWYAVLRIFKYVSLASILAVISLPLGYLLSAIPRDAQDQTLTYTLHALLHASPPFFGTALIAVLVVYRHRGNISRLRRGEEPKIGESSRVSVPP